MIQGNGRNSRRYLYGADAADAFDTILHKGVIGSTYNISSCHEFENIEIAIEILTLLGRDTTNSLDCYIDWVKDRPFNDTEYDVDDRKIRELGWTQKTDFGVGLATTISWYKKFGSEWWDADQAPESLAKDASTSLQTNGMCST